MYELIFLHPPTLTVVSLIKLYYLKHALYAIMSCRQFQRTPKIKGNRMATADEAVLIEPIRVHLEWLTSVLSNYWVPGSILGKEADC